MTAKNASGCCPDKRSTTRKKQSSMRGIAPVRIDVSTLCSGCQGEPLAGGCLRHPCANCRKGGVPRSLSLCKKCSGELGQCRRCRKALAPAAGSEPPAQQLRRGSANSGLQPSSKTTCASCAKVPLPAQARAGNCENCTKFTSSKAYKLCPGCSTKLGQCDRCRKPLKTAKPKPAPARRKR